MPRIFRQRRRDLVDPRTLDRESVLRTRREIARLVLARKRLELELTQERRRYDDWDNIAVDAHRHGNETGAREALSVKAGAHTRMRELDRQRDILLAQQEHELEVLERCLARLEGRESVSWQESANPLGLDAPLEAELVDDLEQRKHQR